MKVVSVIFRILWWAAVILTPLLAVWLASSLAVFLNGPLWVAVLSGSLLFPGLPLIWDAWGTRRFLKKQEARKAANKEPKERWFDFWDRLILRTLAVNLVVAGVMLGSFPKQSFTALSTRGDWFLEYAPTATKPEHLTLARAGIFGTADALEWLHNIARDNPYEDDSVDLPSPDPAPSPNTRVVTVEVPEPDDPKKPEVSPPDPSVEPPIKPVPDQPKEMAIWPLPAEIHPVVANMKPSDETSIEAVATYIAAREKNPFMRVKALHDWVADRVAYDINDIAGGQRAQDAFDNRTSVCAGYSRLLMELGKYTGDEIVYLVGVSRDMDGEVGGVGHAWNAAKIQGNWYLIDVTWNAGSMEGTQFKKGYKTDYLFTPPHIFHTNHLPDDPEWQLTENPISRGEWMRRPMLRPAFYAMGLELEEPARSQTSVGANAPITIANPSRKFVMGVARPKEGGQESRCDIKGNESARVRLNCPIPSSGIWQVHFFAGEGGATNFPFVGQVEVVR